ncbi:hypothetical protein CLOSCI_02868 [[Clostridium] scindens ATCC 35704]|nr:hypothetical protein CLOSCI_02868 [[Clostridium] scindens ATCC 35704]BDF16116.1 hypothetical protein CE91St59_13790 [[Clostridium] scindens]BDF19813.1 hypothetical protein CE91St60_13960 [[Clostridium] scindens]
MFKDDFTQEMLLQDEASRKAELTQKRKSVYKKLSAQYETEQAEIRQFPEALEREITEETEESI